MVLVEFKEEEEKTLIQKKTFTLDYVMTEIDYFSIEIGWKIINRAATNKLGVELIMCLSGGKKIVGFFGYDATTYREKFSDRR